MDCNGEHVAVIGGYYGRSRLGAWIEISLLFIVYLPGFVAPVWERGLKYRVGETVEVTDLSLPFGGVD